MTDYVKAMKVDQLDAGQMTVVDLKGKEVVILYEQGHYYAFENECSHVGVALCGGGIDGGEIICPFHGARFNFKTGTCTKGPAVDDIETYPLRVVDGDIEI